METTKYDFRAFVSPSHRFVIPTYQRNFAWETEQLDDLWRDLNEALHKTHFFGTFLLQETAGEERRDKVYDVIDGQQRLTSVLILLFQLRELLRLRWAKEDGRLLEEIARKYLVEAGRQKLTLQGSDREFFRDYILEGIMDASGQGQRSARPGRDELNTPSRERLLNARDFFRDRLSEVDSESTGLAPLEYAQRLLEKIEGMELMVYKVEDRADAIRVFMTVNDRGKDLTRLEKTKSYLMHRLYLYSEDRQEGGFEERVERVQSRFGNIYRHVDVIDDSEFGGPVSEDRIQQYHFVIWNRDWTTARDRRFFTRQRYLEHIKHVFGSGGKFAGEEEAITDYTHELERGFHALRSLVTPRAVESDRLGERLRRLLVLDRVRNFFPLLMAAWLAYRKQEADESEVARLLEWIEIFTVRVYAIRQLRTNTARTKLYRLARELHQALPVHEDAATDMERAVRQVADFVNRYGSDERIRRVLEDSDVYDHFQGSNRLSDLRLLLLAYEMALEKELEGIILDLQSVVANPDGTWTVEHIWPQDSSRLSLSGEEQERYDEEKHRLGNLALMTGGWNKGEKNRPFREKRKRYQASSIRMLNEVAEHEEWGIEKIEARERKMIETILRWWPAGESHG